MNRHSLARWALLLAFFLPFHAWPAGNHTHYTLLEEPRKPFPKKFVVLPLDVEVLELSAGGVTEKSETFTQQARGNFDKALLAHLSASKKFQTVALPALTPAERGEIDDYLAVYDVVAYQAFRIAGVGPAWEHKAKHFDYTLGGGLKFLKEKTGADAAVVFIGRDVMSSPGRKAAFIFAAAFGVGIPMGFSYLTVGVIDLETGDLLWTNLKQGLSDFVDANAAQSMVEELLTSYPGPVVDNTIVATHP